jgi:hypothetical protein
VTQFACNLPGIGHSFGRWRIAKVWEQLSWRVKGTITGKDAIKAQSPGIGTAMEIVEVPQADWPALQF